MTEAQYLEVGPVPNFIPATFADTDLDFQFVVNRECVWNPSKSYFRVGLTITGAAGQPALREMVAPADNTVGNLFNRASLRAGTVELSSCNIGLAQASALETRLESSTGYDSSIGKGSNMHIAQFEKRNELIASDSGSDSHFGSKNAMYRPVTAATFTTAQIDIAAMTVATTSFLTSPGPGAANAITAITGGSIATCATGNFMLGLPNRATGLPTGAPVAAGDILVLNGIKYNIKNALDATTFRLIETLAIIVPASADWYIIRKDMVRAPQARNTIYVNWRPPMGIMKYDGPMAAGMYTMSLTPNVRYKQAIIETKNPLPVAGTSYDVSISDVKLYNYIEKAPIDDGPIELPLLEYQVQSKPWSTQLEFVVPPTTESLTIFLQDSLAGHNPLIPPSMFKTLDNSDLRLKTINVSYGGYSKPATQIQSNFYDGINQLQARYRNTYDESGIDTRGVGCESYEEWLERGPFYHFTFNQDVNNRAVAVSVATTFNNGDPAGALASTGQAWLYCVAHYRNRAQVTSAGGRVVQSQLLF